MYMYLLTWLGHRTATQSAAADDDDQDNAVCSKINEVFNLFPLNKQTCFFSIL